MSHIIRIPLRLIVANLEIRRGAALLRLALAAQRTAPSIFYRDQRGGGCICSSARGDLSLLRPLSDGFSSRVTLIPVRPAPPQPRSRPPIIKPQETNGRK